MGKTFVVATVSEQPLTGGDLVVLRDGREQPVSELHPDDPAYGRREATLVAREHPDAYFRLRVRPEELWQPPAPRGAGPADSEGARRNLERFLGERLPGLYPPGPAAPDGQRLTTWGWVAAIGSALNAVGLLFFPLADGNSLTTLHTLGGQPTALTRLVAGGWFSPLLGALTAACLIQAFRATARRRLWISVSYVPALIGFAATLAGFYSAYAALLESIR